MQKTISREAELISKRMGKAIGDYDMLQEGDKVLVAVSGGKDSLTLLHMLKFRQTFAPIHFDIKAVHIDSGIPGFDVEKLRCYFQELEIEHLIEKIDFLQGQSWDDINCFWCSWNRRKAFFEIAKRLGFNKIALGHHMDDIIETILLNMFFRGEIGAMRPKQELFDGQLAIIRPLAYESESVIEEFIKSEGHPRFDDCRCPHNNSSKRMMIKQLLKSLERENASIKMNIFNSLKNIKTDYLLDDVKENDVIGFNL